MKAISSHLMDLLLLLFEVKFIKITKFCVVLLVKALAFTFPLVRFTRTLGGSLRSFACFEKYCMKFSKIRSGSQFT